MTSIYIFQWNSLQELSRPSTKHNSAKLYRIEGRDIFLSRVRVDFQLGFAKTIQRGEHKKNSSVIKVHTNTLVREKSLPGIVQESSPSESTDQGSLNKI